MDVVKLLSMIDVFPGQKTYATMLIAIGMMVCQMMGYHSFSAEAWGVLGITGSVFWKMGMDREPVKKGKK